MFNSFKICSTITQFQNSSTVHNAMLTKWVNVLLPYGQSYLAEEQEQQATLDDEKAKVCFIFVVMVCFICVVMEHLRKYTFALFDFFPC